MLLDLAWPVGPHGEKAQDLKGPLASQNLFQHRRDPKWHCCVAVGGLL
ncbi:hypothetical protein BRCON_2766 [Candidatus Sumerlaea chitinivorans]|uniref:Uncharacterized protein n=1 Tax=Sumerlaea chitinivorans TaxID=2250252 RepID=A0A2Z4Y9K6_SUMC1|nr:hypothetical protein BRCON_2766 [Candidatus Sumerlaea chitinivorans]